MLSESRTTTIKPNPQTSGCGVLTDPFCGGGGADQLQRAVERNEYAECAQLIEAVQQLAGHFQSFVAIPKVAELSARVATLQRSVQARSPTPRCRIRHLLCMGQGSID